MSKKLCVSFSLGKDSTLALQRVLEQGDDVIALITSVDEKNQRSWFHGVEQHLLQKVSNSLNIPVIYASGNKNNYRPVFIKALQEAKLQGATGCVFGDIDIVEHREWCQSICDEVGIEAIFPLWQEDREKIVAEFIERGFKALVKTVSKQHHLPQSVLGKTLDKELVKTFKSFAIDTCGENGEYHTFVYDGPLFAEKISIRFKGIHESEYAYSVILELADE